MRREDGRQVDRKKTTEEADRGDGSQRSERWSKGYKPRHAEAMKRADQRRAKRPRCETTEADPKKPTGDVHRDYKAVLLAMIRHIGVGEVRKQLGEVEMGYNPAKEKRQDDASRELSRSKEKRQEEANAIEGREENDPPEQELTETETAYEVSEPPEASNTKELANIEAATRARQDARLSVPVQQDNGNGRFGIGMPLYLVGARKELRENAEKRESDLKNKENDEKQEEKRNKHAAEVKARAARAMEKHVTTSPPKSAASEQGCRCDAVDDIETPAGFCLNTQNQSVRKPAPTAPRSSQAAGISQCTRIADVPPPPDRYKTNEYNDLCRRKQVHHLSPTARTDSTAEITATTHQTSWLGLLAESFRQLTHIQQAAFTAVNDTLALGNMQFETLKDAIQLGKQMLDKVSVKEKGPEAPYPHLSGLPMHVPVLFDMQGGTEDAVLGKVVDFADVATMQNYTDARHTGIIPSFLSDSCLATCKKAAHLDKRLQDPFNDILVQSSAEYRIFEKSYFQVDKGAKLPKLLNNIRSLPNWNEKEGWREEDWREGKEKGDEESSQLKWKKESWKDVRENGGQDSSKQRWSKGGERGESERGGDEISQPLPAGFIPPPPPPSPSVPPTPSSPLSTARGSVGRSFQSDAAVVKANDNGIRDTVLKRVGPTRQPSSQGSLQQMQQMSLEQSRKTETNVAVLNQMLTDLRINSNYRKIPAGCIEQTSGMSNDSARIVKVDSENDMRGLSQLHHYMYTRPHSARVFRL